jgi:hypothetical protein
MILAALLMLTGFICLHSSEAQGKQYYQYVINADGTVSPIDAPGNVTVPIERHGDNYVLLDDIGSLAIAKSNIELDGKGSGLPGSVTYTSSYSPSGVVTSGGGSIFVNNVENVTVKNIHIQDTNIGIRINECLNCTIINNKITKATVLIPGWEASGGILVYGSSSGNNISENQIIDSDIGIFIDTHSQQNIIAQNNFTDNLIGLTIWGSNNRVYQNNFLNNKKQASLYGDAVNYWNNGAIGNFWSDYGGIDGNGDGVGDSPYAVDALNVDHYPLMTEHIAPEPVATPTPTVSPNASPFAEPSSVFITASVAAAAVILASLFLAVFLRRHRR